MSAEPKAGIVLADFEYASGSGIAFTHARGFYEAAGFIIDRLPDCSDRAEALTHLLASRDAVLRIVAKADDDHRQKGGAW